MNRFCRFLRVAFGVAASAALAACGAEAPPANQNQPAQGQAAVPAVRALVLRNFTLIDGRGGPPVPNAGLVAENGRITWVGPAAEMKPPSGAGVSVQDLAGKFVMPGIIDLHTHVANSDGLVQDPKRLFTRENVEGELRLYASYGVTSVLSMGTDQPLVYEVRDEQRKTPPSMARIFTAGRGFTVLDGFPTNKGNVPGVPYEVSDPAQAAGFVDELATHHPDMVKVWVDDRFGDFKKTPINLSTAIIDAAHKHKLKVAAHVFYLDDAKKLVAAGVDALAHSVRDKPVDDELIQLMKTHGTWLLPTLTRDITTFAYAKPEPFLNDPFFTRAAPPPFVKLLQDPEAIKRMTADKYFSRYPGLFANAQRNLKTLADAGVRFGFGTDSGPPNRIPAYLDHWEMELMTQAGLTPMQVITSATGHAAEFLGARELGTLEAGKWADVVVLGADPLTNIRNTRSIDAVYVAGNRVK